MPNPPQHTNHRFPYFLPDGKHFIFFAQAIANGVYIGSLESQNVQRLLDADTDAVYVRSGYLLFVRQGILLAQRFDVEKLQAVGEATPVGEGVSFDTTIQKASLSAGGDILAYRSGTGSGVLQLVWFNRQGQKVGEIGAAESNNQFNPSMAPDSLRIAIDRSSGSAAPDIWLLEATRGVATRFTFDKALDRDPVWSPDGSRIVFGSNRNGIQDLYQCELYERRNGLNAPIRFDNVLYCQDLLSSIAATRGIHRTASRRSARGGGVIYFVFLVGFV